jgi:hypothetical protein
VHNPRVEESPNSVFKLRAKELTIVVPPTTEIRIETLGQAAQRPSILMRPHHASDTVSNPPDLIGTDPWIETREAMPLPVNRSATSELETEKVEPSVPIGCPAAIISAIDNLRLGGMEGQTAGLETLLKTLQEHLSLLFGFAVTDYIICVPFKPNLWPIPLHPHVKCVMQI